MNKRLFLKSALGTAFFLATSRVSQAMAVLDTVERTGVLRIGTETAFAPFDFIDLGKHVGLNVELFDQIGKDLGVRIEWVALPWAGVLPGLEAGKFDLVAGPSTITRARIERYRYLTPIANATDTLLKRAGDKSILKPSDISGKVVGAGTASAQLTQLQDYVKTLPGKVEIREYPGNSEAYADLAAGRIVAVANSLPNIAYVAKQRPNIFEVVQPPFGPKTYFGYVGSKDPAYKSLLDTIENAILKMKADGRLAQLQKKWFGTTFETPDTVTEPNV